jgi:hypothetical protein
MVANALKKPRLIYQVVIERKPYFRRFRLSMFGFLAAAGAVYALNEAYNRRLADLNLLNIGWLVAVVLAGLLFIRAVTSLVRGLSSRNELLRIFDRGLSWERNGTKIKYGWDKLVTFREGGRGIYIRNRPLVQWGAHTLSMDDGQVLRITPRYGNLRKMSAAIRPFAADITGSEMGRTLREEQPIQIHPRLTVWPGGVQIGKREIPWTIMDVRLKNGRLAVRAKDEKGRFKVVRTFPGHTVDNLGGFVELATATIRNYQPERFKKKPTPSNDPFTL